MASTPRTRCAVEPAAPDPVSPLAAGSTRPAPRRTRSLCGPGYPAGPTRERIVSRARRSGAAGRLLRRRAPGALVREQFGGPLVGEALHRVTLAQRGVDPLAVGHVRPVPAVLDDHLLARCRVGAQLAQRWLDRCLPPSALGLGVDRERLVQGDGEQLLLVGQRSRVGAPLEVGTVTPVLRGDL